jgi:hypothetical protein
MFPVKRMKLVVECLSASFGCDSCCIWSLFLCLACVSLSDGHSDQQLLIIMFSLWKYVDVSILVNKIVQRNSSLLLFVLWMLQNLRKAHFCSFNTNLFYSNQNRWPIVLVAIY